MSQMLVIPHRFKKIGLHNLVARIIFSDILLVLGLKKVEKHCTKESKRNRKCRLRVFAIVPIVFYVLHTCPCCKFSLQILGGTQLVNKWPTAMELEDF
jgi:hypothetical protein